MAMDPAVLTINALATTESMASLLGLSPIALEEPALNILLGLVLWKTLTMLIPLLSAPIRELAIERPVSVLAMPTMTELPASALFAPIDAAMLVSVSPRSSWLLRLVVFTLLLGMLRSKLVAFVIWEDVVQTALCLSVPLVPMC